MRRFHSFYADDTIMTGVFHETFAKLVEMLKYKSASRQLFAGDFLFFFLQVSQAFFQSLEAIWVPFSKVPPYSIPVDYYFFSIFLIPNPHDSSSEDTCY